LTPTRGIEPRLSRTTVGLRYVRSS
jgi:hypothetical protein